MKKILLFVCVSISFFTMAQVQTITPTITPNPFERNESITITIQGNQINEATWGVTNNSLYIWAWMLDANNVPIGDCPTNGTWNNSNEANKFTYNAGNDTYTLTFVPQTFYNNSVFIRMGFLVKAKDGTGDKKTNDNVFNVGAFQATLTQPVENSATIINAGQNINITATSTSNTTFTLKKNGITLNSNTGTTYAYTDTNITSNGSYELAMTNGTVTFNRFFNVIVNPGTFAQAIPANMEDGINYYSTDTTKALLKLNAPGKDFVYVAGSFNNWNPDANYAMRKDPSTGIFWLELTGLTAGQLYTYQYWVVDQTPTTNSPALVKTADMYSYQVLSNFDDPWIPATTYPNLPTYPVGQNREVSVLQTGQTPYSWSAATLNFQKPNKDKLVVYEALIRDFDANRNIQDLINKIDYFKNLKVNAIQLMPIMEYEGNESWGYNTSFHLAMDKFYGTEAKMKEFIDLCHQNGIAVILDVALNHSFGRNPGIRMWMKDADNDGWGEPAADNPYYNEFSKHAYGVGADFNHQSALTKYYTKRVVKRWIQDFKIDGFRWDLTKGFTQNCATGDEGCTNAYQQDRVDVLKEYADYSWSLDPTHIVIFEHLGGDNEEQQWANYKLGEGKGILMWGELHTAYKQLMMGYSTDAEITRMGYVSRGFSGKRLIGYPESHDKDRLVYEGITYGNGGGTSPVQNNLNNALTRMRAIGALSILVPGPKMIWGFGSLGNNISIYTCNNGSVNDEGPIPAGDCKLDTKPQLQWSENWMQNANRMAIYNDWAKMIDLKITQPVFNGEYSISSNGSAIKPRIYIFDNSLPTSQLKNVVILANMSVANQTITADFPYVGTWYNLMDNTSLNVTNTAMTITLTPGEYRIFGNQSTLSNDNFDNQLNVSLFPNPTANNFYISTNTNQVELYNIAGQLVKSFKGSFTFETSFDVSDLKTGIYFVTAKDSFNKLSQLKLIIE